MKKRDRRSQRSHWASEALQFQLQQVSRAYKLESMILADTSGHLWAASSMKPAEVHLASSLAGIGILSKGSSFDIAQQRGKSISVKRLKVGEAVLYLAAQGVQPSSRRALEHASSGVERILETLI